MQNLFTPYSGTDLTVLTSSLLAVNSGVLVNAASIVLRPSGADAVNVYDGSLSALGIGAGLLLTTGTIPGVTNTVDWFGQDNSAASGEVYNGDADIDAVVNSVFQTQSYDATTLSFDFTVSDSAATSVSFDIVVGSDEYPEWVDQFVDCAIVMVNGINYALFNHDPNHPLSVVSSNLAAGYFQDNAIDPVTGVSPLPIEYDGVSHALKIVAPIINGGATNHIKIGIADTGDHIYDSGMFIANFAAGVIPGSGVVSTQSGSCTESSDAVTGSTQDEYFDLQAGDDTLYAGGGDDIVVAGQGNDVVYGGSGNDEIIGGGGDDTLDGGDGITDTVVYTGASSSYSVEYVAASNSFVITDSATGSASEGKDSIKNVEQLKFSDGLFALGMSGLTLVSDTGITPPPSNTPGIVIISGVASAGHKLTATVSDPDGITGTITWQWQVSSDNGLSWTDIAEATDKSFLLLDEHVEQLIQVFANYTDNGGQGEMPVSTSKAILPAKEGDSLITLIQLDAPSGSSIINPLTTLLKDAIDLGISPNIAAQEIKKVLGIPADVHLQSYDAYAVLQLDPLDVLALTVEKIAVQIAILTSLSDDDTGMNLTLAILDAAVSNTTYDLADLNDICAILGLDPSGTLPESVNIIIDRNSSIASALSDGGDVTDIEKEWIDFCSNQDDVASTSIADLSIRLNQAPVGSAAFVLPEALQEQDSLIASGDLLQGFIDPDGDALEIAALNSDANGSVQDNNDGTWSFTPFPGYTGPVELTYTVQDGQGGSIAASQLLVVVPAPPVNVVPVIVQPELLSFAEKVDYATGVCPYSVSVADVNADGLPDLIVANSGSNTLSVMRNAGSGIYPETVTYSVGQGPFSVTSADVTGDGYADLIVQNYYNDSVSVLRNLNGTAFEAKADFSTGYQPWAVTTADVDGDGDADLIVANYGANTVSVLKNNGSGSFAANVDYGTGDTPYAVTTADLNGDEQVDLIVANGMSDTVSVLINSGGIFAKKVDYGTGDAPFAVLATDVDGNGSIDLVLANGGSSTLSVLKNSGNGIFAAKVDYAVGGTPYALTAADVNGDGLADLIIGYRYQLFVSVLKNNGDGTFAVPVDYPTSGTTYSVASADVDGDGRNDLIAADYSSDKVSVLINTSYPSATIFTEQTPVKVTSDMIINDPDGDASWDGGLLELQISGNAEAADSLSIATTNPGGSGIWLDTLAGNKLMSGTTEIGSTDTASVSGGSLWTLSFNGNATNGLVQAVARSVWFNNSSDTPDIGERSIIFTVTDSSGLSASAEQAVAVNPVNDLPEGEVTIAGLAAKGQTLTAGNTLVDPDGLGVIGYMWQADGVAINGAVGDTLRLGNSEVGKVISVTASYMDQQGSAESVSSLATSSVVSGHSLAGGVTFWKTGMAIAGVTSMLTTVPVTVGSALVEFRNIQMAADGTRTIEIWENSTKADIGSLQLEFSFSAGAVASWQDAALVPLGWSVVANSEMAGRFLLGGIGATVLVAGPVKLGTLTLTAPANPQHFDLSLDAGELGNDKVPLFGIASDSMTTGSDGLYQHLAMTGGTYGLTSAKVSGVTESNAVTANDALAALKIAVGINPNADNLELSPFQYLAADINKDGTVKASDALNILKMAVKLNTAPEKEWLFVPDSVGSETMSRTHVVWPDNPIPVTLDVDQELHLIGIVKGDVNGSWVG